MDVEDGYLSQLGICVKHVHLIPHSGTGESLKTFDKKKKKNLPVTSQHLQIPDMACKKCSA